MTVEECSLQSVDPWQILRVVHAVSQLISKDSHDLKLKKPHKKSTQHKSQQFKRYRKLRRRPRQTGNCLTLQTKPDDHITAKPHTFRFSIQVPASLCPHMPTTYPGRRPIAVGGGACLLYLSMELGAWN